MVIGVLLVAAGGFLAYRHHQKKHPNSRMSRCGRRNRNRNQIQNQDQPQMTQNQDQPYYGPNRDISHDNLPRGREQWDDELPTYSGNNKDETTVRAIEIVDEKGERPYRQQEDWEARGLLAPSQRQGQGEKEGFRY